ncbi:BglG family transcriptional antiterminator [Sinobaca qinghaiensis]|uniref:BglG family transcriptional antiterminator n=1 Tax=Sinobaca qinghaiensis TaxID=342944 RepID=A0A419V037_9BACL|nr:PRD domain-containing protein [Sinobaca qinghaiensis]RKD71326.1 BglG family transcriptional antiterminator [Sinobaca qinghaiensis]
MKISKILNNNVVVSVKDKQEVIVMGRGVAFNKKVKEDIDEAKVEKIFTSEDKDITKKFKDLIAELPLDYMEISEEIIQYARLQLGKKLNDSIYISLTDHIHFAVERHTKGLAIKNGLLWETKNLYKEEYEVGMEALNMIFDRFNVVLPEDEAGFIALHLVNAQLNEEMMNTLDITKVIQDILTIVKYSFKIEFDENSLNYHRFITHLKFFAHRLVRGEHYKDKKNDLLHIIIEKYPEAYQCSLKVKKFMEKQYQYEFTEEEILYLTIHIERVVHN